MQNEPMHAQEKLFSSTLAAVYNILAAASNDITMSSAVVCKIDSPRSEGLDSYRKQKMHWMCVKGGQEAVTIHVSAIEAVQ
jgi:hypothetical protein